MLVLSRKVGEKLLIGDNIVVSVAEIHGNRVRLSIEAPNDVRILRGELAVWAEPAVEETAKNDPWKERGTTDPKLLLGN